MLTERNGRRSDMTGMECEVGNVVGGPIAAGTGRAGCGMEGALDVGVADEKLLHFFPHKLELFAI